MRGELSRKVYFLFFFTVLLSAGSVGQTPYYEYFTIRDGLPSQTIYQPFQDNEGYMWFATEQGVSRYDGYTFRNFNMKDGLSDNEIMQIRQDKKGRIWFLTLNGKISYYYKNKFYNAENDSFIASVKEGNGHFTAFAEDNEGNSYLSTHHGDIFQIHKDGTFRKKNFSGTIFYMWHYKGHLYIVKNNGLWYFKDKGIDGELIKIHDFVRYSHPTKVFVYQDNVIITYGKTLEVFDLRTNVMKHGYQHENSNVEITYSFIDSKGKFWLGTRSGIYKAESLEEGIKGHWNSFLTSTSVSFIAEDTERNIWITSMGKGVFLVPNPDIQWLSNSYPELQNTTASCLFVDRHKTLWIGLDKNSYATIKDNRCEIHQMNKYSSSGRIMRIKEIGDSIWIVGKSNIRLVSGNNYYHLGALGNDIILDKNNYYWLAFHQTINARKDLLERCLKKELKYGLQSLPNEMLLPKRSNVLYEDRLGGIWIGTFEGLYIKDGRAFKNLATTSPLLKGKINDLETNPHNGNLLVATDNYGILEIDIKTHQVVNDSKFRQLGKFSCFSITLQGSYCWLGTNKGIILVNVEPDFKIYHFSDLLGLQNLHVSDIAVTDNKLYATTSNGLLMFNNIAVDDIGVPPPRIYITNIINKRGEIDPFKNAVLKYAENEMTISFKGISFKEKGDLLYKYRLEGIDKDFRTTASREVVLKALPAGNYTFSVYAVNKSGQKSTHAAEFHFRILKPIWQQWWFILAGLISCTLVLSVIWKIRLSIVRRGYELEKARVDEEKKRLEVENKLVELEQHTMRLQMNPHFIFNALNSIKGYYAEKKIAEADEYISRFSKILRHILENSERYSSLQEEIDIINLYLEMAQMRYPGKFEYRINVGEDVNTNDLSIPCMLLQPFVENAIMHGIAPKQTKGLIHIDFYIEEEHLICKIFDDGVGITKGREIKVNKNHQSKAIEITRKRLDYISEHEGIECTLIIEDSIKDNKINGTLVFISLPTKKLW